MPCHQVISCLSSLMSSPRKSTARMSTGGKPPGKPLKKNNISDDDNDNE